VSRDGERRERLVAAYRRLLRLYSRDFRRLYEHGMVDAFRLRSVQAAGRGRFLLALWVARALADVLWNAPLERITTRRDARNGDGIGPAFVRNVRFALRQLARNPGLAVTLVLTLGIGTGVTTSFFAVVDAALLRPLPYPEPDRLVLVRSDDPDLGPQPLAPPYLADLRARVTTLESLGGFSPSWSLTLTGSGEPRLVVASWVSDGLLRSLGATIVQGRLFEPAEHDPSGPAAGVVSESFWARQFGPGVQLDGQSLRLDGGLYTIVGVARDLPLPITSSLVSSGDAPAELWLPFARNEYADLRMVPVMNVIARLPEGMSTEAVERELARVGPSLPDAEGRDGSGMRLVIEPLEAAVSEAARPTTWILFGAATLLLLIACANAANLLLARATARAGEVAVRRSLGAGPAQLGGQLLTESLVLAMLGGAVGLAMARLLLATVGAASLPGMPPSAELRMDPRLASFAAALSLVTVLLFGLVPALHALSGSGGDALRQGARGTGGGGRARQALVTVQVALAVTLLVGGGLLGRSLLELVRVDPGFRAEGVLHVPLPMAGARYAVDDVRTAFLGEALERVEAVAGVQRTAAVNRLPLGGNNVLVGVEARDVPASAAQPPLVDRRVATPGYLEVMAIPLLKGRGLEETDAAGAPPVGVVNAAFQREVLQGLDPLGRQIRLMLRSGPGPWITIVGVAADVRHHGLDRSAAPEIYVPYAQAPVESMVLVASTMTDPGSLGPPARAAVWSLDPDIPLDGAGPLTTVVRSSMEEPRFRTFVVLGFAVLALLLAAIGIYGVMAYTVAQRTRETAVRLVLGARAADVVREVVGQGLRQTTLGIALGMLGGIVGSRLLAGLLFEVDPIDPPTYLGVAAAVLAVGLASSYPAALRAARIDPVRALAGE
jgi:predicted permease